MSRFQRRLAPGGEQRTTTLELFYDLVFVFAVTQISDLLKHELNWPGLGKAVVILLVVWWAWNYTTWVMNELDPGSTVVRGLLIALTLLSLLMAVAIPDAFGSRALLFVCSYVALMVGRNLFLVLVSDRGSAERERADRVLTWLVAAGVLWVAGGLATGPARVGLWLAALAVDYAAPLFLYRVPRRPALGPRAWEIATGHFSDRFQLFVIIALGESIVVTGATAARLDLSGTRMVAFSVAFLAAAAMWWLYFSYVAGIAERRLELAKDRTRVARDAYTYLHVVIVGGVIVAAVGDAIVIAHPTAQLSSPELAAVVSGAALYLLGLSLFRLRLAGSLPPKRLLGAVGCGVAGIIGAVAPAIVVSALVVAALAGVIVAEEKAARRRRARGEPSPLEQLEATAESSS